MLLTLTTFTVYADGMYSPSFTDQLRAFFRKSNFYTYHLRLTELSENFSREYQQACAPASKRNLRSSKTWSQMDSFGEQRRLVVIDLGGTNLNLFEVEVTGDKQAEVLRTGSVDFYKNKIYTLKELFSDLKKQLDLFILASEDRVRLKNIVFLFSYPIDQVVREDGYVDAVCTYFGKMRRSKGIIGAQIGEPFEKYLRENGYPNARISVTNDTPIYGLAAKAYEILESKRYDAALNIIVGTGTNIAALFDDVQEHGKKGLRIVNTEFGDFKSVMLSRFDEIFDKFCDSPGRYLTEKMISGTWQHQMFKVIVTDLVDQRLLNPASIKNIDMHNLDSEMVEKLLYSHDFHPEQKEALAFTWREINKRGGSLCGIMLADIMVDIHKKLGLPKTKIVVTETGSVLKRNIRFRESLFDSLDRELGRQGFGEKLEYQFINLDDRAALGAVVFDTYFAHQK